MSTKQLKPEDHIDAIAQQRIAQAQRFEARARKAEASAEVYNKKYDYDQQDRALLVAAKFWAKARDLYNKLSKEMEF